MSTDLAQRVQVLKGFPLFKELKDSELELIAGKMEALTLPGQTELLKQNQDADASILDMQKDMVF
jgi:hypothetical protein